MTVQLLHLGDLHFGGPADLTLVEAVEEMLPDLRPDVVVVGGDLTTRARHGEFQRARAFVRRCAAVAPVHVSPGNHDVQWWWRPLVPFARGAMYEKYARYFGPDVAPTLSIPGAVIATALTSHGIAWGSLTLRPRDLAVKGHLPKREWLRVRRIFAQSGPDQAHVLVVHHNVLQGELSQRWGLARWRTAQRRLIESGAHVVLCGHDHQEGAEVIGSRLVISTTGTMSRRQHGGRPACFNVLTIQPTAVQVTFFRWEAERKRFRPSDTFAFARGQEAGQRDAVEVGAAG